MEALKEMFNRPYYEDLASVFKKTYPAFKEKEFVKRVTHEFEPLSLNQRMRNTSVVLKTFLPENYTEAIGILSEAITLAKPGYTNLLFPDYAGLHGLHDFNTSLKALRHFTIYGSSEFAIREFLKKDFERTLAQMYRWAGDKNHHVRRLASEGSRPRLPWSFKLEEVIKNPSLTTPILEQLKSDNELYVRKSVANHLNDISKENPDYMIDLVKGWDMSHPHTAWIIKHASRTLIKKGNSDSLMVFNFEKNVKVAVKGLKLEKSKLRLGQSLVFEFDLVSLKNKSQKLVVDYVIHYRKKAGELSPKVFKLSEVELAGGDRIRFSKKQLIKDFTTRKHYPGVHRLEIQVNGKIMAGTDFELRRG